MNDSRKDPLAPSYLLETGDSEAVRARNAQLLNDLEAVMKTEAGRRYVWRQIKCSNLNSNAMTGNAMTYFNLGQQSTGQELMTLMFSDRFLKSFRLMQDEALSAERVRIGKTEEKKHV